MPFTLSVSPYPFTPKHTCPFPCQSHCVPSHPNTQVPYLVSLILSLHTQTHMPFTLSVSLCPFTPKHTCPLPCQSHCVLSHPNTHALYLVSLIVSFHTQTHMPFTLSVSLCPFTPKHTCPLPCQSHSVLSHPNTHALYLVSLTLSLSPCPFTPKHTYHLPAWLVSLTLPLHTQTHMPWPARSCPVWGWWLLPGSSTCPCCRAGWRWGWWSGDRWPPCRRSADPRECRSCGSRKSGTCCRWRIGVWGWSWWPCRQDDEGQRSRCKRSILNSVRKQCQLLTHVTVCPVFLLNSFIFCLPVGLFQHWNQTQWHCSSAICYSSPAQFQNGTANLQLNWHAIRLISQIWLKKQ